MNKQGDQIRINLKLKNNRLIEAREQLGLSAKKAAENIGISYSCLLDYENFKCSPLSKSKNTHDHLTIVARKISEYYGLSSEWLWDEDIAPLKKGLRVQATFSVEEAKELAYKAETPASIVDREVQKNMILKAISTLSTRQQRIIKKRFYEGKSLQEIGDSEGISRERVRQDERKALSLLKHCTRLNELKENVFFESDGKTPMERYMDKWKKRLANKGEP